MKKRFFALILCLAVGLTACGETEMSSPVWEKKLDSTGVRVTVSNCTVEQTTENYWETPDQSEAPCQLIALHAGEDAPVFHFDVPKSQIDVTFAMPVDGGYALYTNALPVEQVDMIPTENEDGTTDYRFDTIYNFVITVKDGERSDRFLLICSRKGYHE